VGTDDFIIRDEKLVHGRGKQKQLHETWGRVHLWQLRKLAKGRRSFWAVALLACIQLAADLQRSKCRDSAGWVKVSARLLAGVDPPSAKAKRAALNELEKAGIVEVRRRGHQAPEVRLLPPESREEAVLDEVGRTA
jgi:hypothetical protein